MDVHTTRRGFIVGAATSGLVSAAAADAARTTPTAVSPRLVRLIALHDRAEAQWGKFDEEVEMPARRAYEATLAAHPVEPAPPHERSATSFVNAFGDTIRLSTETAWLAGTARRVVSDPTWADMGDADWRRAHREIADAFDRRAAIIAEQAGRRAAFEEQAKVRCRLSQITARSNALDDRCSSLWHSVVLCPAATIGDVAAKFAFITRTRGTGDLQPEVVDAISADAQRLAKEAPHA